MQRSCYHHGHESALYEVHGKSIIREQILQPAEDKSTDLLGQVLTLGDELFAMGLSLNTKDNDKKFVSKEDAYAHLFNSERFVGYDRGRFLEKVFDSRWSDS